LAASPTGQHPGQEALNKQQKQKQQQQPPQQQQSPRAQDSGTEEEQQQRAEELLQELVQHPHEVEQLLLEAAEREGDMCVSPAYIDAIVDAITHPEIGALMHGASQLAICSACHASMWIRHSPCYERILLLLFAHLTSAFLLYTGLVFGWITRLVPVTRLTPQLLC
jgi:hypothetical protein